MAVSAEIRLRLIAFARSARTRRTDFTPRIPCKWQPGQVTNPATGQAFTEDSAWLYVADCLEAGAPIEIMILDKPAGKTAYVVEIPGVGTTKIYVKLQMGGDHVRGRSFHPPEKQVAEDVTTYPAEVSHAKRSD